MAGVNGIEIKVGQVWRCRNGDLRTVAGNDGHYRYPWDFEDSESVDKEGRVNDMYDEHDYDLIELVQDENGFTIWHGGECPVPADARGTVRFRNGAEATGRLGGLRWADSGNSGDVVAYKLLEQPATDAKDLAADMLSDLGWNFRDGTWVQDDAPIQFAHPDTEDSALAVQVGGSHYKDLAIQPIEYIHANKLGFAEGNVVKYITRHRQKHGADDIRKVIHYCQLLLELEYGGAK
jgi:hypothetical protein